MRNVKANFHANKLKRPSALNYSLQLSIFFKKSTQNKDLVTDSEIYIPNLECRQTVDQLTYNPIAK